VRVVPSSSVFFVSIIAIYHQQQKLTTMAQRKVLSKKRRIPNMAKDILPAILVIALGSIPMVRCQTDAFTRQETCPSDSSLTGYTNIPNLNDDMAAELARIEGGGDAPDGGYSLILCPGESFDASGGNSIRPVLDQVSISCGGPDSIDPECIIEGGEEQLMIQDSTVDGYTISSVSLSALTFNNFGAISATMSGSDPTIFTCTSCVWQDFEEADNVAEISGSMTMRVVDGTVTVCSYGWVAGSKLVCVMRSQTHIAPLEHELLFADLRGNRRKF
jgi:hypothetical protein